MKDISNEKFYNLINCDYFCHEKFVLDSAWQKAFEINGAIKLISMFDFFNRKNIRMPW